jgi:hypothetical protein
MYQFQIKNVWGAIKKYPTTENIVQLRVDLPKSKANHFYV